MIQKVLPYFVLWLVRTLRLTCPRLARNDLREELRASGKTYIYAGLHAQQIATMMFADPGTGAMISRSKDGDLVAKTLEKLGVVPVRGSGGASRKGGAAALKALVNHVESGRPAFLAVDGPKGPRGVVHPGAAMLAIKTGQPVVPLALIPRRRIVLEKTWDRTQIPLPFFAIDGHFGDPIYPRPGESVADLTARIQEQLLAMQRQHDAKEAAISQQNLVSDESSRAAA